MKAYITETIEYEVDIPDDVDPTAQSIEEWFVNQDASKLPLNVTDRSIEIVSDAWKIQTASANGWADIKESSEDGETYLPSHYDSKEEAEDEMLLLGSDEPDSWRVVPTSTPQDDELYE